MGNVQCFKGKRTNSKRKKIVVTVKKDNKERDRAGARQIPKPEADSESHRRLDERLGANSERRAPLATTEEECDIDKMAENDELESPSSENLSQFLGELDDHMEVDEQPQSSSSTSSGIATASSTSQSNFTSPSDGRSNLGEREFFTESVNTITFVIPKGYSKCIDYLGGGSYGNVIKSEIISRDGMKRQVAIKKLKDPLSEPFQARRIYREIKLLQLMNHDNIIRALDLYTPDKTESEFKDLYVVTEYAGNSLYKILRNQQDSGTTHLNADHIQFIVYQLLRALKYIHSANIMHRDLKPGNLALTSECDLTVLDFGLARSMERTDTSLTQYVMTRWYRAPEVIYWKIGSYSTQADIWSVGCIAAELMMGKPLFPGDDANAQYMMITKVVGSPDDELKAKIRHDNPPHMVSVVESFDQHPRVDFRQIFLNCDEKFIDFVDRILVLDPERRLTVEQALQHPYIEVHHDPDDEPVANWSLDDDTEKNLLEWRAVIWKEVQNFTGDGCSPKFC